MKKPKKALVKFILLVFLAAQFTGFFFLFPKKLESANLANLSDTLSNNRLSFRGELTSNTAVSSGVINLETTPGNMLSQNTSTGSAALMGNENVKVGNNAPIAIKTIDTASRVVLASGLTNAATTNEQVVATVSAVHTATFTPVSSIPNGAFRVLIPAGTTVANDGIPDKDGFDIADIDVTGQSDDVTCSGGGAGYTWAAPGNTASASAVPISSTTYHSFECRYSGNGGTGTAITMKIGLSTSATHKLINPSPSAATGRAPGPGGAESYPFRVQHTYGIDQSYSVVDWTPGTIGVVEAVRVTATVSPILTFTLAGVAASTSTCGISTSVASTPTTAPFGNLTANALTNHIAQLLTVSTNAAGGYTVTASESAALTAFNVANTPTIPDTTCQATPCTVSTPQTWTNATYTGFGYALHDVTSDAVLDTLEYANGWRPFGTTAQPIMRANPAGPADADQAYVCYRAVISGSQAAGDYENYVIFIATATF